MNVVVAGGGFAGVRAALELAKARIGRITLVSQSPYLSHHDALQFARTGVSGATSRVTLEDICADYPSIRVVLDTVISIDVDRKHLVGKAASYDYDELIMALGASPAQQNTSTRDTLTYIYGDLRASLDAAREFNRVITVVGGGCEGVELVGAVREYTNSLLKQYPGTRSEVGVQLVERQSMLLPRHSPQARRKVEQRLRANGVKVLLGTEVSYGKDFTVCADIKLPAQDVIWANGTVSNSFYAEHPQLFHLNTAGLVEVDPHLETYSHIYVIGQNVAVKGAMTVKGTLDMADFVVDHLLRISTREHPLPYHPTSVISSIEVDARWAYVECFGVYVTSRIGYVLSRLVTRVNLRKIMSPLMTKIFVARSTTKS